MKPSIGRIVHYQPTGNEPETVAAIITAVRDSGAVNLAAFLPSAEYFKVVDVPYSETPKSGCWSWPPRV